MSPAHHAGRILVAGNWHWEIYEEALARGFAAAGLEVIRFSTDPAEPPGRMMSQVGRLRLASCLKEVNRRFLDAMLTTRPDLALLIRCDGIMPGTLISLRSRLPQTTLAVYHNDNPFLGGIRRFSTRHFLGGLRHVHHVFVYRPGDMDAARRHGARSVSVLLPSYLRDVHRPTPGGEVRDVLFLGHFENDGRGDLIDLLHGQGVDVRVSGPGWERWAARRPWHGTEGLAPRYGKDYAAAISAARISLVFLSHRNRDVYTRRCFEIPACASLMLAPHSPELSRLFEDRIEAVYWRNPDELVTCAVSLLRDEPWRRSVAEAGHRRVLAGRHDEYGRAAQVLSTFEAVRQKAVR